MLAFGLVAGWLSAEEVVRWAVALLVAVDCRRSEARSFAVALAMGCLLAQV
jgi:hypothetical protein